VGGECSLDRECVKTLKRCEYCDVFLSAAASAAPPNVIDVDDRYCANVSVTVTSHVTHLPFFHGIGVRPSGRFPSDFDRPDGSLTEVCGGEPTDRCLLYTKAREVLWRRSLRHMDTGEVHICSYYYIIII